jgi:hypothetical protein
VTQTAEVDVNNAVTKPVAEPSSEATGSVSSTAPPSTTTANATTTARAGCAASSDDHDRSRVSSAATARSFPV